MVSSCDANDEAAEIVFGKFNTRRIFGALMEKIFDGNKALMACVRKAGSPTGSTTSEASQVSRDN
jgi:hypothetical protein